MEQGEREREKEREGGRDKFIWRECVSVYGGVR